VIAQQVGQTGQVGAAVDFGQFPPELDGFQGDRQCVCLPLHARERAQVVGSELASLGRWALRLPSINSRRNRSASSELCNVSLNYPDPDISTSP
jgi:hypothetical protein